MPGEPRTAHVEALDCIPENRKFDVLGLSVARMGEDTLVVHLRLIFSDLRLALAGATHYSATSDRQ